MDSISGRTFRCILKDSKGCFDWYIRYHQECEVSDRKINAEDLINWYESMCSEVGYKYMAERDMKSYIGMCTNETKRDDIEVICIKSMIADACVLIIRKYMNKKKDEMQDIKFMDVFSKLLKKREEISEDFIRWGNKDKVKVKVKGNTK
jgi:hypothetical protein